MPQSCRVCAHPNTKEIETAIINGVPNTLIAEQFDVNYQSVRNHAKNHLPDKLIKAAEKDDYKHADGILSGITSLLERTNKILDGAEERGHNRLALEAIKEARSTYELLSKIAVKMEEYRRRDEDQKESANLTNFENGLSVLTDGELETLVSLLGKVHSANPEYEHSPTSQAVIECYSILEKERNKIVVQSGDYAKDSLEEDNNKVKSQGASDLELDDLELNDLEFEEIPSENTDLQWVRDHHRRTLFS